MSTRTLLSVVMCVILVSAVASIAAAQPPQPPAQGDQGQGGDQARQGMRGMMMMPQAPAIAVADGYVFVVSGGTLFQFAIDGLKLVGQVQLPMPAGRMGGQGGGFRGGAGAGG